MASLLIAYGAMVAAQTSGPQIIEALWGEQAKRDALAQDTSSVQPTLSMEEICQGYAAAHFDSSSNVLHAAGMLATMLLLGMSFWQPLSSQQPKQEERLSVAIYHVIAPLLWIPPIYYLPAWVGHFGFQKDIPAVFTYGTTLRGWWMGEACAWIDLFQGGIVPISKPFELAGTAILSHLFVKGVVVLLGIQINSSKETSNSEKSPVRTTKSSPRTNANKEKKR